ncbi:RNA polymerase sigma factor [Paenibacillus monticola]|uniref:Sigma-70 family RNA polymerase sigma factor n=1 Tax=Paenibacillus monticola TaxID=2666075 RepID=A0A7X2L183_9BACL|nr:RNA polymerase sigma factor [Paenibacillus monticola]MRN52898.1 sigma-70 family RNA polymerase sigma factor [Paenibacillus monticola]
MIILDETNIENKLDEHRMKTLQATLNRYCRSLTGSSWDAEDLAQDTWIKVFGTQNISENPNVEALLLRIAKNTWIDITRRKTLYFRLLEQQQPEKTAAANIVPLETEIAFQALLNHLSPLQRSVFLLRDVLGYSAMETAELLKTTEGAVKAALHRARQALPIVREELTADGPPIPLEAGFRAYLKALAFAYEEGQIPALLELIWLEEADKNIASIGYLQAPQRSGFTAAGRSGTEIEMRFAA